MPKQVKVLIILVVIAGLSWYWWQSKQPTAVAGDFSGWLEGEEYQVVAETSGKVDKVLVAQGDQVKKGQQIAKLDSSVAQIQLLQAQANLAVVKARAGDVKAGSRPQQVTQATAQVAALKANLDATTKTLARAKQQRERLDQLVKSGAANQDQLDAALTAEYTAQAGVASIQAQIKAAQDQVNLLKAGATTYNLSANEAQVLVAQEQVDQAKLMITKTNLTAPASGRVEEVVMNQGELVAPGAPVVKILNDTQLHVLIYVPQSQLGRVKTGQSVTVKAENGGAEVKGKIVYISVQGEFTPKNIQTQEQRATQVFAVKVALGEMKQAELKPGQTVIVNVD